MRPSGGIRQGLATITAHHVSELDHHLRAMRAANAALRERIDAVRAELVEVDRERARRTEIQRSFGAKVLVVEIEIEQARMEASDHLAAVDAAADEEVQRILADGRAEAEELRRALEVVVARSAPGNVFPLPQLVVSDDSDDADDADRPAPERSAAM